MKCLQINVLGKVQGVGFRYFAKREAIKLELSGWVKNNRDQSVDLLAQGSEEKLNQFIKLLNLGSSMSSVQHVEFKTISYDESLSSFDIIQEI